MTEKNKLNLERTDKIRIDLLNYFKDNYTDTELTWQDDYESFL